MLFVLNVAVNSIPHRKPMLCLNSTDWTAFNCSKQRDTGVLMPLLEPCVNEQLIYTVCMLQQNTQCWWTLAHGALCKSTQRKVMVWPTLKSAKATNKCPSQEVEQVKTQLRHHNIYSMCASTHIPYALMKTTCLGLLDATNSWRLCTTKALANRIQGYTVLYTFQSLVGRQNHISWIIIRGRQSWTVVWLYLVENSLEAFIMFKSCFLCIAKFFRISWILRNSELLDYPIVFSMSKQCTCICVSKSGRNSNMLTGSNSESS